MVNGKHLIALCTSRIYDPQIYNFIKLINEDLRKNNCALFIFTINSDIYWEEDINPAETYVFDIMPYDELDCIVIMDEKIKSHKVSNRIISKAKQKDIPVVVLDGDYEGTIKVNFDYDAGFEAITRHIIEHHHVKHPHMMAGIPGNVFSERRIAIFKKVLRENNIAFDESMLSYGHFWADPTREAMTELLKRDEIPDAIICANDIMAINVSDMLKRAEIKVPEQVLVSGFDGYDEIFFSSPKIASCTADTSLLAASTADKVIKLVNKETVSDTFIVPELIPNESCGCPSHIWNATNQMANFNNNFYRLQDDTRILYNISSNMETSKTVWDMAASIHEHKTKHTLTVVDRNIFNENRNFFMENDLPPQPVDFHIISDADYAEEHRATKTPLPKEVFYDDTVNTREDVLSGNFRDRIIELMDSPCPLIFNALDYMNRPFGFVCFYYRQFIITDYSRAAIITSAISMGIGGFVNLQYQRHLLKKVDDMYKHDALTGLYNRLGFMNVYEASKKREENLFKPVTVIMSDLDGLKYINDNFGHADGDRSISAVANALKASAPENALSARFGGDELFTVIIGDCDANEIMQNIDEILKKYNEEANLPYPVSTSSGAYTSILTPDYDFLKALKVADEKMYTVKNRKRRARLERNIY